MNHEVIDILYRSRNTLLDHLDEAGYETTPYRKISVKEIGEMMKATSTKGGGAKNSPVFQMDLMRKKDIPVSEEEPKQCRVVFCVDRIKHKLEGFTQHVSSDIPIEATKQHELILVTLEPVAPNFHTMATKYFLNSGLRVRYFQAASIVNNPLKHVLVPKHEKVPKAEEESLLTSLNAKKNQFPFIRFHEDMIARMIGLLPGDIVKITRPSPTAGECIMYRVCVP